MDESFSSRDTLDGQHLSREVIHALACGNLESKEKARALAHLGDCQPCRALLADAVRGLPDPPEEAPATRAHTLQVGSLVGGRYRICRFVARGGMGEVYEAWDVLLSEQVALKTINPLVASADQAKAMARFKQEVQLSRRVADPHVCRVYEFGQHMVPGFGTLAYLTMEFIEGQTLGARLRKGPRFAQGEVIELSRQILRGLAAAHAVGVLHRDLKSDNVMIRDWSPRAGELHVAIMDFGLARVLGDPITLLTERHELVGSVAYMAPEQLEEGATLSEATDVFAFGVVLFEMLTGRLPFEGKSVAAIAMQRVAHRPPSPSSFAPGLSSAWDALVLRCLERDVERRFGSTEEVSAALEAMILAPNALQRRRVAFGASALALLVCALAYLALQRGSSPPRELEAERAATPPATEQPQPAAGTPQPAANPPPSAAPGPSVVPQPPDARSPVAGHEPDPVLPAPPDLHGGKQSAKAPQTPTPSEREPAASPASQAVDRGEDVRDVFYLDPPEEPPPMASDPSGKSEPPSSKLRKPRPRNTAPQNSNQ